MQASPWSAYRKFSPTPNKTPSLLVVIPLSWIHIPNLDPGNYYFTFYPFVFACTKGFAYMVSCKMWSLEFVSLGSFRRKGATHHSSYRRGPVTYMGIPTLLATQSGSFSRSKMHWRERNLHLTLGVLSLQIWINSCWKPLSLLCRWSLLAQKRIQATTEGHSIV